MTLLLTAISILIQAQTAALDNAYARVSRNTATCPVASKPCGDRIIVALGDIELTTGTTKRAMKRGDIFVFGPADSYRAPTGGDWLEVVIKPDHPSAKGPAEQIPPDKNVTKFENDRLFIFEERLAVRETRERHSHRQRVVIQLNKTKLRQWPDGEPMLERDIDDTRIAFNEPVIHKALNIGDKPLRGIVIEIKGPNEKKK
jgi:hypothetical protein